MCFKKISTVSLDPDSDFIAVSQTSQFRLLLDVLLFALRRRIAVLPLTLHIFFEGVTNYKGRKLCIKHCKCDAFVL